MSYKSDRWESNDTHEAQKAAFQKEIHLQYTLTGIEESSLYQNTNTIDDFINVFGPVIRCAVDGMGGTPAGVPLIVVRQEVSRLLDRCDMTTNSSFASAGVMDTSSGSPREVTFTLIGKNQGSTVSGGMAMVHPFGEEYLMVNNNMWPPSYTVKGILQSEMVNTVTHPFNYDTSLRFTEMAIMINDLMALSITNAILR
jgi:hypothetical protein